MKGRSLWFIVLGLIVAAVLLALLRPPTAIGPIAPASTTSSAPIAAEVEPPPPVAASFDFVVKNGQRTAGPVAMQAREGDDVVIKVTSDRADEMHLHGYDLHTAVRADQPAALYFKATHTGRFEVELHHANLQLGVLEVMPR